MEQVVAKSTVGKGMGQLWGIYCSWWCWWCPRLHWLW